MDKPTSLAIRNCPGLAGAAAHAFGSKASDAPLAMKPPRRVGRPAAGEAQQVAVYLCHILLGLNYTKLGLAFGLDRTTIRRFCYAMEDRRDERRFDQALNFLELAMSEWIAVFSLPRLVRGRPK